MLKKIGIVLLELISATGTSFLFGFLAIKIFSDSGLIGSIVGNTGFAGLALGFFLGLVLIGVPFWAGSILGIYFVKRFLKLPGSLWFAFFGSLAGVIINFLMPGWGIVGLFFLPVLGVLGFNLGKK